MAKSWSGFMPQNAVAKEQWILLEASRAEVERYLNALAKLAGTNPEEGDDFSLALALEEASDE